MADKPQKIFKKIQKQRDKEFIPQTPPDKSYDRKFIKRDLHWFWHLVEERDWGTLFFIMFVFSTVIIAAGLFVYFILGPWIISFLEGLLIG